MKVAVSPSTSPTITSFDFLAYLDRDLEEEDEQLEPLPEFTQQAARMIVAISATIDIMNEFLNIYIIRKSIAQKCLIGFAQ